MSSLRKAVSKEEPHTSRSNRIWFATRFPDKFSPDKVSDVTSFYLRQPQIKRIPYGAFVFSPVPLSEIGKLTMSRLFAVISLNLAGCGMIIPTELLGSEWKFDLPKNGDLSMYLRAISLMVLHRIRQVENQMEFVGSVQPFLALKTGEATCFERASVLAAIFRLNLVPARVVGNTEFMPVELPIQRHHWWVEAKVGETWERFDPSIHPSGMDLFLSLLATETGNGKSPDCFLEVTRYFEFLRSNRTPIYVTDEPSFQFGVKHAIVAPEMDVPKKYPTGAI